PPPAREHLPRARRRAVDGPAARPPGRGAGPAQRHREAALHLTAGGPGPPRAAATVIGGGRPRPRPVPSAAGAARPRRGGGARHRRPRARGAPQRGRDRPGRPPTGHAPGAGRRPTPGSAFWPREGRPPHRPGGRGCARLGRRARPRFSAGPLLPRTPPRTLAAGPVGRAKETTPGSTPP